MWYFAGILFSLKLDDFTKTIGAMVSIVGASGRTPNIGRLPLAPTCKARKN
jgi:hypothetical protein